MIEFRVNRYTELPRLVIQIPKFGTWHAPYFGTITLDALPKAGFLVEAGLFETMEIAARDHADDAAALHDRNVTEAAILHQP